MKKYLLTFSSLLLFLILWALDPAAGTQALRLTGQSARTFLLALPPVFLCVGLLEVWVPRPAMAALMGERAGWRGAGLAFLLGMVTAVPFYALLPVAAMLLKKGARIRNMLLFLCASNAVRVPLWLFEAGALGWTFALVRLGVNTAAVFATAQLIEWLLTPAQRTALYRRAEEL